MRETGLEPARYYYHQALNLARLPISPFPQRSTIKVTRCIAGLQRACQRLSPAFRTAFRAASKWSRAGTLRRRLDDSANCPEAANKGEAPRHIANGHPSIKWQCRGVAGEEASQCVRVVVCKPPMREVCREIKNKRTGQSAANGISQATASYGATQQDGPESGCIDNNGHEHAAIAGECQIAHGQCRQWHAGGHQRIGKQNASREGCACHRRDIPARLPQAANHSQGHEHTPQAAQGSGAAGTQSRQL